MVITDKIAKSYSMLDHFTGKWNVEGYVHRNTEYPLLIVRGSQTWKWMAGEPFLSSKTDIHIGDNRVLLLTIVDPASKRQNTPTRFPGYGNYDITTASLRKENWVLESEWFRFSGKFCNGNTSLNGICEYLDIEKMLTARMDVMLTKIIY